MTTPTVIKKLSRNTVARSIACWLGVQYIRMVDRTSFWKFESELGPEQFLRENIPFIACFWHGRLMMMGSNWSQRSTLYMLISNHADGKLIACIIRRLGFKTLGVSSKKSGNSPMRSMLRVLKEGNCVGFTPDGPRGPRMRAKLGAIVLARLSGAPIVPTAFSSTRRKLFNSWDKFLFARMFSQGVFLWGNPIWVPKDADDAEMERLRQILEDSLNSLTKQADINCGHSAIDPAPYDNVETTE